MKMKKIVTIMNVASAVIKLGIAIMAVVLIIKDTIGHYRKEAR